MKNPFFTLFIWCCLLQAVSAQSVVFQKSFSNGGYTIGRCVRQTNDGGYIFTGYTEVLGAGIQDMYLVKTDADGDTLWTKTYGGSQYDDGFCVEQTTDGGYIVVGYTNSFGAGAEDVYLVKTNVNGDTLWTKTFGGPSNDRGASVIQSADGGYIISGETLSYGAFNHNVYIIKTNNTGDILWTKVYGGNGDDYGYDIIQDNNGEYLISGNHSTSGAYLIKLNEDGDSLWTKGFVGAGPPHLNGAFSVKQTADNSYVFAGISYGSAIQSYLQKLDGSGNPLWSKTFSGVNHVYTTDVTQTSDGGFILSGWSQAFPNGTYKSLLIRTNESGDTLWTKRITGGGSYSSVQQTTDGGFVLLSADNFNIYLTKTDSDGNTGCNDSNAWPEVITPATTVSYPVTTEATGGDAYVTSSTIESGGTITSLCYACNLTVNFSALPDTVCSSSPSIPLEGNPTGGTFSGPGIVGFMFDPSVAGPGLHELTYTFAYSPDCAGTATVNVFVETCTLMSEMNRLPFISIYPNPANQFIEFHMISNEYDAMKIIDSLGRQIHCNPGQGETWRLNTSALPTGMYFCLVTSGNSQFTQNFFIQH